ncbi:LOB domain-containing protein 33 [Perilla frutescens var. hirtella]|nr:LOB domain-containing protein 33 [Perilla frutescens var. hirtella]KAH6805666.1 LOB domain-containing protein 33 [Perilla frutescens var. frutescens]
MTGVSSSCGACKFLRRRCTEECIFAPYFCYEQAATHFAAVHKVFGASNVSKLLAHLPVHSRSDAAITISYEALARMQDPIYGCVAHIFALQQQVASLAEEIEITEKQMANLGINAVPYETSNPYFFTESDITSNCTTAPGLPILHSMNSTVNQACCSQMELPHPGTSEEVFQGYFNSSIFDRLLEELSQDYYLHEEVSQDYYLREELSQNYNLQSLWMKYAAPQF